MPAPERYLRLLLEDQLGRGREGAVFVAAMRAVVGAQLLEPAAAGPLAADAVLAFELRGHHPPALIKPLNVRPPRDERAVDGVVARLRGGAVVPEPHGQTAADRYLWDLIATRLARLLVEGAVDRALDAQPAVDALAACGAIAREDPIAVQALLTDTVALGLGDEEALTSRIRTVLDARDHLGREGTWAVTGPPALVDGTIVGMDRLSSDGAQLWLDGAIDLRRWSVPVGVTATDDRGGWYVGAGAEVDDDGVAHWLLVPSLDPEAVTLTVTACGPTEVATWPISLA